MGKYFVIQLKRLALLLPAVLCVMALLFGGIYLVYRNLVSQWTDPSKNQTICVGMVGTANDRMLNFGLQAMQSMDDTDVSVEILQMEEKDARKALERGEIAAYVVFPEGFMSNAMGGKIMPLQFVSAAGGENIVSMVKDELTSAIANMLLVSEKGSFALDDILDANGMSDVSYHKVNELALSYAKAVIDRADVYTLEELGMSGGLGFEEYMISGLSVVFLFFMTLPFVAVFVKEEPAMEQLLKSKRVGAVAQVICELVAYVLLMLLLTAILLALLSKFSTEAMVQLLPVVFCVCAISYLVYSLSRDLLSGVLLQLLISVALCFVSGCMYPVYFFPESVQNLSRYLPAAMARNHIAAFITGAESASDPWPMVAIGGACVVIAVLIRRYRIGGKRGARL